MSDSRISGASATARTETDIRLNYGDPSRIIAAANDSGGQEAVFFSTNGGGSWGQSALGLPLAGADTLQSDPAVDWTSDGVAHALCIGIDPSVNTSVRAYQSTDNGQTWTLDATPSGAQTGTDREIIWVDKSAISPFKDQVYATWHNGTPVFFARKTAGAGSAWQPALQVSGSETMVQGIGGDIKTNAFGDVYVFWPDADGSRNIVVAKSTDGGVTFPASARKIIAQTFATTRKLAIPSDNNRRARVYTSGGAYKTATKDLAYVIWSDLSGAAGCNSGGGPGSNAASTCKTRVWFSRSTDGGNSWSAPVMLNNQASLNDQFHSKLCVDESNGNLIVTYRDTVNDPNRLQTNVFMQTSTDDGQTWTPAVQVSSAASDETTAGANPNQYGDYDGLSGFFGSFFPAWTDRRSGGAEEIWSTNVSIIQQQCFFILDRSTFGQDEVKAMLTAGQPTVNAAFYVVVDGFKASDLGITAADLVGTPSVRPVLTSSPAVTGMTLGWPTAGVPNALIAEDPSLPPTPQRFTWVYAVNFSSSNGFTQPTLNVTLNASIATASGSAVIQLVQQENPYEVDGATSWLSTDLRVFFVKQGQSKFNVPLNGGTPTDAINFINAVLNNLNPGGNSGGQTFENDLDPTGTDVALNQFDGGGNAIFNFAIAKVRYRALSQDATATRVFFRLCPALTVSTAFDPNTTYRTFSDGVQFGHKIPRLGLENNNILTIPFFAAARVTPGAKMDTQPDPTNVITMPHDASGNEVVRYFGCWLDINQPGMQQFPLNPTNDGPYSGTKSILELVRNQHQCLLAEISYDLETIPTGATPASSDKLAQRNLTLVPSANPGDVASRRIPSAFELKPTPTLKGRAADELMIDWGNVPPGSFARIYLPTVSADEILELLAKRYGPSLFKRTDAHTLECRVQGITYLPIPPGAIVNHTGLLTVDLPPGVKKGQRFDVLVRQVAPIGERFAGQPTIDAEAAVRLNERRVIGSFQVGIPVSVKEVMLEPEERLLAILRWIQLSVPPQDRWYAVFNRYVEQIAERVAGLGGDPSEIGPSPTGELEPTPTIHPHPRHEQRVEYTGKISSLIFDQFGDFEGFALETEERYHKFFNRERDMKELAERVWSERLHVTVYAERDEPHRPLAVAVHRPPVHFKPRGD
jgi:hypothetical protein